MSNYSVDPAPWGSARDAARSDDTEEGPTLGPTRYVRVGARGDRQVPVPLAASEDQLVFQSDTARLGIFAAAPKDLTFRFSGLPGEYLLVFPQRSVRIQHQGRRAFVADMTGVVFLDPEQIFFRTPVDPEGDRSVWLAPAPSVLQRVAAEELGEEAATRLMREGFPFAVSPIDNRTFQLLHQLAAITVRRRQISREVVDAAVEEILRRSLRLGRMCSAHGLDVRTLEGRSHHFEELVQETLAVMGERFATDFAVADVARQLGCSYSRLSAEFKRRTGKTLHQYRIQLRLRRAFVELLAGRDGLADLASSLGFSTHSHFTSSFRAAFGLPPSDLGRRIDERSFRQALAALQGPMRSSS